MCQLPGGFLGGLEGFFFLGLSSLSLASARRPGCREFGVRGESSRGQRRISIRGAAGGRGVFFVVGLFETKTSKSCLRPGVSIFKIPFLRMPIPKIFQRPGECRDRICVLQIRKDLVEYRSGQEESFLGFFLVHGPKDDELPRGRLTWTLKVTGVVEENRIAVHSRSIRLQECTLPKLKKFPAKSGFSTWRLGTYRRFMPYGNSKPDTGVFLTPHAKHRVC